jgi:hypothetical protein
MHPNTRISTEEYSNKRVIGSFTAQQRIQLNELSNATKQYTLAPSLSLMRPFVEKNASYNVPASEPSFLPEDSSDSRAQRSESSNTTEPYALAPSQSFVHPYIEKNASSDVPASKPSISTKDSDSREYLLSAPFYIYEEILTMVDENTDTIT